MPKAFGLDFGTTNSAVACASENGVEATPVHRSVLYFEPKVLTATGNNAIDRYLAADEKGRLIQSLKSFLASRLFTGTNIYERQYSIEDLLTIFLRDLRKIAERKFGPFQGTMGSATLGKRQHMTREVRTKSTFTRGTVATAAGVVDFPKRFSGLDCRAIRGALCQGKQNYQDENCIHRLSFSASTLRPKSAGAKRLRLVRPFGQSGLNLHARIADTGTMKQRRKKNRNMCAELLMMRWTEDDGRSRSELATLEDISATGVCLHLEQSIPPGTEVSLHYPKGKYQGKVKYCTSQEIGYLLGIAFDDGHRWSRMDFQPSHLLELRLLHSKRVTPV